MKSWNQPENYCLESPLVPQVGHPKGIVIKGRSCVSIHSRHSTQAGQPFKSMSVKSRTDISTWKKLEVRYWRRVIPHKEFIRMIRFQHKLERCPTCCWVDCKEPTTTSQELNDCCRLSRSILTWFPSFMQDNHPTTVNRPSERSIFLSSMNQMDYFTKETKGTNKRNLIEEGEPLAISLIQWFVYPL